MAVAGLSSSVTGVVQLTSVEAELRGDARRGMLMLLAGAVLGFARSLGEFGATIMIAGSIPGATRTLAVAIYSFTDTGRDADALRLVGISAAIAFAALWLSNYLSGRAGIRA